MKKTADERAIEILTNDMAMTEEHVRESASKVLTEKDVYGDRYGVPTIEDITDKLVEIIEEYKG